MKCVETLAAQERCDCWNVPGDTPAMVALKQNKKDIVKILLTNNRVDLELKDKNGDGLITIAHKTGDLDLVKMIDDRNGRDVTEMKRKRQEITELRNVKKK